ncbi:MAG: type II toxin-antitoxin system RatA family toxin [Candidatus Berkiellales bacterium]
MTTIVHCASVPFSCAQMFELVNDIEQYPHFLPWCPDAKVQKRTQDEIEATVHFAKGIIGKSFTTLNKLLPHQRVEMRLLKGPFRYLEGTWHFESLAEKGSRITLNLSFEFNSKLLTITVGPIFHHIASTLVQAFTARAHQIYSNHFDFRRGADAPEPPECIRNT